MGSEGIQRDGKGRGSGGIGGTAGRKGKGKGVGGSLVTFSTYVALVYVLVLPPLSIRSLPLPPTPYAMVPIVTILSSGSQVSNVLVNHA